MNLMDVAEFAPLHLTRNLGALDALIAATAIGQGATLLTFNGGHFRPIPGLKLTQPYTR